MTSRPLDSLHRDYVTIAPIVDAILTAVGGQQEFNLRVPIILRTAIDEVIDAPRTHRFLLGECEKTEKTYLGTKVEILLRSFLRFKKGKILDMEVSGTDVDIKNTMHTNWSVPTENVNRPAILIRSSETRARCDVGVGLLREDYLRQGANQDKKRGLSAQHFIDIWWLLWDHPYPINFWQLLSVQQREKLIGAGGGSARVAALFQMVQRRPISRTQIQDLARQHDYMKRIRRNGGARDLLAPQGIAILSGAFDQAPIQSLGLGLVTGEEFISYAPINAQEISYLKLLGHID